MMSWYNAQQIEMMRDGIARAMAGAATSIPESDQCVNTGGSPDCTVRAEKNGWCKPCGAALFPPGWNKP